MSTGTLRCDRYRKGKSEYPIMRVMATMTLSANNQVFLFLEILTKGVKFPAYALGLTLHKL